MNVYNNYSIINILIFIILLNFALCETCEAEYKTGTCKNINDCTGKYKPVSGKCKGETNIQCCIKRDIIPENNKKVIIDNLKKNLDYGNKNDVMIKVASVMLDNGYDPKFIAGMLGNIQNEGCVPGGFENSNYSKNAKPNYLKCIEELDYKDEYSGKTLTEIGITKTRELYNKANNTTCIINNEKVKAMFGLGIVQWTDTRTDELLKEYEHYNNFRANITIPNYPNRTECIAIEANFIVLDLERHRNFNNIYDKWLATPNHSPYSAGFVLSKFYEKPRLKSEHFIRGKNAVEIYKKMYCQDSNSTNEPKRTVIYTENNEIGTCKSNSYHFSIDELCYSEDHSDIDNKPSDDIKKKLTSFVVDCLEPIHNLYKKPIIVTSGYRNDEVNKRVTKNKNSQHKRGEAADLKPTCDKDLINLYNSIIKFGNYDQFIIEKCQWAHVSYKVNSPESNRHEIRYYDGNKEGKYPIITHNVKSHIDICKKQLNLKRASTSILDDTDTCYYDPINTEVDDEPHSDVNEQGIDDSDHEFFTDSILSDEQETDLDTDPIFYDDSHNDDEKIHNDDYINDKPSYTDMDDNHLNNDNQEQDEEKEDSNKIWILVALGAVWSAIVYVFCCRCF